MSKQKKEPIRGAKESSFAYMQRLKRAGLTFGSDFEGLSKKAV